MYYPLITTFPPHLTEVIPLLKTNADTLKSEFNTGGYMSPPNRPNKPRAEHPVVANSCDPLPKTYDGTGNNKNTDHHGRKQIPGIGYCYITQKNGRTKSHIIVRGCVCCSRFCAALGGAVL